MSTLVQGAPRSQSHCSIHCCESTYVLAFMHLAIHHTMYLMPSISRMLLDLQGHQDEPVEKLCEYLGWALEEANFSVCSPSLENAWAAMAVSPNTFLGEICYYLAKRTECPEHKDLLIKYGIGLIEKSIEVTRTLPFANMYAIKKLNMLKSYAEDSHESSSIS